MNQFKLSIAITLLGTSLFSDAPIEHDHEQHPPNTENSQLEIHKDSPLIAEGKDCNDMDSSNYTTSSSKANEYSSSMSKDFCIKGCPLYASHIQIGANYTYAYIKPAGNTSSHGNLGGMQGSYQYRIPKQVYGALLVAWRDGSTHGSGLTRTLLDVNTEERIGYTFSPIKNDYLLSLFTGLGFQYFHEKVSTGGNSVIFNYAEFYVPLGFLLNGQITSAFSLGLNFEWMSQIYPALTVVPLHGAHWKLTRKLANFLVEVPFTFSISKQCNCFIQFTPFFKSWYDGYTTAITDIGTTLDVPSIIYLFGGANLNFQYSF